MEVTKLMEIIVVSVLIGVTAVLLLSVKMRNDVNAKGGCPKCGTPVPGVRTPTSLRQALWGGWTCAECGTEMDRKGEVSQTITE